MTYELIIQTGFAIAIFGGAGLIIYCVERNARDLKKLERLQQEGEIEALHAARIRSVTDIRA